jgi:hypothetical protein
MRRIILLASLLMVTPDVLAQEDLVGKEAGEFTAGEMLYDVDVLSRTLEECRGDVILIKYWGLKCGPCKAAMPGVQRLWGEYRDRGLHIFHVESQNHTVDQILAYCEKMGYDFPQTLRSGETDFTSFPGGRGLPYAFLVGVDGKVIWQGRTGYEAVIAEEIQKVRYPHLGRTEVPRDLRKSAKLFSAGKYGRAVQEARKRIESDAALAADGEYIISRADRFGERMRAGAEAAAEKRDYGRALEAYEKIASAFKGLALADEASERIRVLKADADVKKELKAARALKVVMAQVKKAPTREKQIAILEAFAKKFQGTRAAETATRRAKNP